jgi:rod shape determining protein RodA
MARPMYIFAVGALMVIFVVGEARFGSARWVDTGLILIQPSELAKIIMILVLADYFARNKDAPRNFRWIAGGFLLTAGLVIWIILQPNLSTSIVIFVLWFSLMWFSGLPLRYLAIFIGLVIIGAIVLFPLLQDYQQLRILNFFFPNPEERYGETFNVQQALITIGSGGWFGEGYGQSGQVQLRFLKVRHTDFIFSVISGEFGFVGAVVVVLALTFVIYRCVRAAQKAVDMYGALIAYGFATLIFFQTIVNIGVNLNVIPVTGLTLPFVSYGGSSLLSLVLGIGLVESVISRRRAFD